MDLNKLLADFDSLYNETKAKLDVYTQQVKQANDKVEEETANISTANSALDICNVVLMATQNEVKTFIEEIVTLALQAVFGEEYGFEIEYDIKRNKSEAKFGLTKYGQKFEDMEEECGGGVVDVISFALRIALWALTNPTPSPIMILDEPGKHISMNQQEVFAEMLSKVSKMFGMQMIVVSHSDDIINVCDRAFQVKQIKDVSQVEEIK